MYDIVFISYNEPNADENFANLKARFPMAKRVHGIKGIHNAHIAAAKKAFTKMVWIVDADAEILESFKFDYKVPAWDLDVVHVWKSKNPVNGLEYGYGGVKLLPRHLTLNMNTSTVDMTMSISSKFKAMDEVSNVTAFNTDAFSTWRSAFRECCKLTIINNAESLSRLDKWCTDSTDVNAMAGATAGKEYGEKNASDLEALSLINNFDWLKNRFEQTRQPLEKSQR